MAGAGSSADLGSRDRRDPEAERDDRDPEKCPDVGAADDGGADDGAGAGDNGVPEWSVEGVAPVHESSGDDASRAGEAQASEVSGDRPASFVAAGASTMALAMDLHASIAAPSATAPAAPAGALAGAVAATEAGSGFSGWPGAAATAAAAATPGPSSNESSESDAPLKLRDPPTGPARPDATLDSDPASEPASELASLASRIVVRPPGTRTA